MIRAHAKQKKKTNGKYSAYCSSIQCFGDKYSQSNNHAGKLKENVTDPRIMRCPDCGHYLFWQKNNQRKMPQIQITSFMEEYI